MLTENRYTGKGVGVAVLDTGIFPHVDFDNRIVCFQDFVNKRAEPYDDNGHGTHVNGLKHDKFIRSHRKPFIKTALLRPNQQAAAAMGDQTS